MRVDRKCIVSLLDFQLARQNVVTLQNYPTV